MNTEAVHGVTCGMLTAIVISVVGGILSLIVGQLLPRRWFDYDAFPFRAFKWENGGRIYEKLKVRAWKDHVPDMSLIIPKMVKKKAALARTSKAMDRLIRETCVSEFIHWLLEICICAAVCIKVRGALGAILAAIYAVGNLLFIIIQRYNRPRLRQILRRMEERERRCS